MKSDRLRRWCGIARSGFAACAVYALAGVLVPGAPASAQEKIEDVFGGMGEAQRLEGGSEESTAAGAPAAGEGSIFGRVFDGSTGTAVEGATVILKYPPPEGGAEAPQQVQISNPTGEFEFSSVPAGSYTIHFVKAGYRASTMTNFGVAAGEVARADFPLPPLPTDSSDQVLDLEAFVVEESIVNEMMSALELRMESDALLNVMSAEDFSKFAATDVADALKRVAGVNVVEGQFAIIRGLEDRYSSTLFNSAPIPSPDPDRQSVQLDLFPAEVISNLVVVKTFVPESPGNSAGGSIDIVTQDYPDDFEFKVKAKSGFNDNAIDGFLRYDKDSPVGVREDGVDTLGQEYGAFSGGRYELFDREIRLKAVANFEVGYDTGKGWREGHEPRDRFAAFTDGVGDLSDGELFLSTGRFKETVSEKARQETYYGGFGFDLDEDAKHRIDASYFHTRKQTQTVRSNKDGYFPGYDYLQAGGPIDRTLQGQGILIPEGVTVFDGWSNEFLSLGGRASLGSWITGRGKTRGDGAPDQREPGSGPIWFGSFRESRSFEVKRKLEIYQLNGNHDFGQVLDLPGTFHLDWAANRATTTQDESALGLRFWKEPCGWAGGGNLVRRFILACPEGTARIDIPTVFPVTAEALGPGKWTANRDLFLSANDIDEQQWFWRFDLGYEVAPTDWLALEVAGGVWRENSERDVSSAFVQSQSTVLDPACVMAFQCSGTGQSIPAVYGDSPQQLGRNVFNFAYRKDASGDLIGTIDATNSAQRDIDAWNVGGKATLWERLDLLAGIRIEGIRISSDNDPFLAAGTEIDGTAPIFPSKYLFFEAPDNTVTEFDPAGDLVNNGQLVGLDQTPGVCLGRNQLPLPPAQQRPGGCIDLTDGQLEGLLNTEIDENKYLPSFGIAYRPLSGLTLRGAYSRTVARPSFREMAYYVSTEPGSDDLIIGNPLLKLSEVESYDARLEYVLNEEGDLFAFSGFYKLIDDPIESIILRNPVDFRSSSDALFRTFLNNPSQATLWGIEVEARKHLGFIPVDFASYFSVGGNFTYIHAEVDRTDAELSRSESFFQQGGSLDKSRRLFGQPEWIVNADISFDQPEWGTKLTLAFFAISDVLDAAGSASPGPDGKIQSLTLDRYIDSFNTLDLIFTQRIWGGLSMKFTAKNLTDSRRDIVYDRDQTGGAFEERSLRLGRDYSLQLTYSFSQIPFL